MFDWLTAENLLELTREYRSLGPIIGFLLPFLEAFLPFLPLFVFVFANASAYGLWIGFLLSWAGTTVGSYLVFIIIRKYGRARFLRFMTKHERVQKLIKWIEKNGFGPLFLLLCFPFSPSALVNVVAGLSDMKKKTYLWALLAGKFVMILTISFIGYDIKALITQPIRTAIVVAVIVLLWLIGKQIENRLNARVEADFRMIQKERQERKGPTI
ncbi:TVP38/TMEM64 family protein [Paenisporosarcina antarctica]|uniref:TVP38/TMEM64 family membrane protein n=1 Tax=Paenisporosarcina antarctica TaxID=417367 RepID=A0A4P6ZZI0_9BACL|nr:TVP38/TMEM64 family protein [Paenisporosarcina antarctica]QBP41733.1 TVP38/TMEM64 family protein [Paenisporosarcina antarctica]